MFCQASSSLRASSAAPAAKLPGYLSRVQRTIRAACTAVVAGRLHGWREYMGFGERAIELRTAMTACSELTIWMTLPAVSAVVPPNTARSAAQWVFVDRDNGLTEVWSSWSSSMSPEFSFPAVTYGISNLHGRRDSFGIPSVFAIKPDPSGQNNWTKVSAILWYRSTQRVALDGPRQHSAALQAGPRQRW
jgi:hypothetical protein